jgi:hypothetical protein
METIREIQLPAVGTAVLEERKRESVVLFFY